MRCFMLCKTKNWGHEPVIITMEDLDGVYNHLLGVKPFFVCCGVKSKVKKAPFLKGGWGDLWQVKKKAVYEYRGYGTVRQCL